MKLIHTCMVLALLTAFGSATTSAQPQQQTTGEHTRAKTPEPVTGELIAIDVNTKTLVLKTSTGNEMKFSYSDETVIVGGEKGAAGLATSAGSILKVTYDVHGTANVALKIEVLPKPKS